VTLDSLAFERLSDGLGAGDEFERSEDRALGFAAVDWEGGSLQTGKCERLSAGGKVKSETGGEQESLRDKRSETIERRMLRSTTTFRCYR
jgi:hypothetical protein